MPTSLDSALNQRNLILAFAGVVTAVTAWSVWNGDLFPNLSEPKGDPENWTEDEMKRWLNNRKLMAGSSATREELLARVKANMRAPSV